MHPQHAEALTAPAIAYDSPLDPGIAPMVELLARAGVETYESCQGGPGHSYAEPAVRFHGDRSEGFRALAWLLQHDAPVSDLARIWPVIGGEPTGPYWQVTFRPSA